MTGMQKPSHGGTTGRGGQHGFPQPGSQAEQRRPQDYQPPPPQGAGDPAPRVNSQSGWPLENPASGQTPFQLGLAHGTTTDQRSNFTQPNSVAAIATKASEPPQLVVSATNGLVDAGSLAGWFPKRNIHISDSDVAVVGNNNQVKETDTYDIRKVVISTDRLQEWLTRNTKAREALRRAVAGARSLASASNDLAKLARKAAPPTPGGPSQVEAEISPVSAVSIYNSAAVVGDDNEVTMKSNFRIQEVEVDLLECLQRGLVSPTALVEAIAESAPGPKAAGLVRSAGRAINSAAPTDLLTREYSVPSATVRKWFGTAGVSGATVAMAGTGNELTKREISNVSRTAAGEVKSGLADIQSLIIDKQEQQPGPDPLPPPPARARAVDSAAHQPGQWSFLSKGFPSWDSALPPVTPTTHQPPANTNRGVPGLGLG